MDFVNATSDEVLFGGAAGGGKSFGQLIDAMVFAIRYKGSRQLILRRTLVELERTLILNSLILYPKEIYSYNISRHIGTFAGGSTIEFGYCDAESDVHKYQSAEYDVIRFDELTHFTEQMYIYLISRVRGVNGFPKQVKSTTNPGGVGHEWVKRRFVDIVESDREIALSTGTRIFLRANVRDNFFLMKGDKGYLKRLENLSEGDRRALLDGEWNLDCGRYFDEWKRDIHVVKPFEIPKSWRRYFVMDYGLDMLAGYFIALDGQERGYVYKEIYESNHIISSAAKRIAQESEGVIEAYYAPSDLWSRRQESGLSAAEIFYENGVPLVKANTERVLGWYALKEWLKPFSDEFGTITARLVFFSSCVNAIRTLGAIMRDANNPNDCAREPHELIEADEYLAALRSGEATRGEM